MTAAKKASIFIILALFSFQNAYSEENTFYIQTRSATVRVAPQHWAASQRQLSYGDRVNSSDLEAGWYRVTLTNGQQGYIHQSAVSTRRVILNPSDASMVGADAADIVIAGKGFTKEIEQRFAEEQSQADFVRLDQLVSPVPAPSEIRDFYKQGGLALKPQSGAIK